MEVFYLFFGVIFLFIQVAIIRWALKINTIVKMLSAMLSIQAQQAKLQGLDKEQLSIIMDILYGKGRDATVKNLVG